MAEVFLAIGLVMAVGGGIVVVIARMYEQAELQERLEDIERRIKGLEER